MIVLVLTIYGVKPRPALARSVIPHCQHHDSEDGHGKEAAINQSQRDSRDASMNRGTGIPSPETRPELRIAHYAHDEPERAKGQVVEAYRRLRRRRMADSILTPDGGRIQKQGRRQGVAEKPKAVEQGEVWHQTMSGPSPTVEYGLGEERDGPRDEV